MSETATKQDRWTIWPCDECGDLIGRAGMGCAHGRRTPVDVVLAAVAEGASASLARTAVEVDGEFRGFAREVLPWLRKCEGHALSTSRRELLDRLIATAEERSGREDR